jgi:hypothetical protein
MDQTYLSIVPESRYSPVGGMYSSYEFGDDSANNLYLSMGREQYTMYDNMYAYQFTDMRGLTGLWEHGNRRSRQNKTEKKFDLLILISAFD